MKILFIFIFITENLGGQLILIYVTGKKVNSEEWKYQSWYIVPVSSFFQSVLITCFLLAFSTFSYK